MKDKKIYGFKHMTIREGIQVTRVNLIHVNKVKYDGIKFDNKLQEMDTNVETRIKDIQDAYQHWLYKYMSGRLVFVAH